MPPSFARGSVQRKPAHRPFAPALHRPTIARGIVAAAATPRKNGTPTPRGCRGRPERVVIGRSGHTPGPQDAKNRRIRLIAAQEPNGVVFLNLAGDFGRTDNREVSLTTPRKPSCPTWKPVSNPSSPCRIPVSSTAS